MNAFWLRCSKLLKSDVVAIFMMVGSGNFIRIRIIESFF